MRARSCLLPASVAQLSPMLRVRSKAVKRRRSSFRSSVRVRKNQHLISYLVRSFAVTLGHFLSKSMVFVGVPKIFLASYSPRYLPNGTGLPAQSRKSFSWRSDGEGSMGLVERQSSCCMKVTRVSDSFFLSRS